jgi:hypothetical protein
MLAHYPGNVAIRLFVTAMLALAMPVSAHAASPGVVPDLTWGTSAEDQTRTTRLLERANVRWVRLNISWSDAEPIKGSYNASWLARYDRAVRLSRQAGARVILMISTSPAWASRSSNPEAPPHNRADYARFVRMIATRYAGRVSAYEIWNEPDLKRFWPTGPSPLQYALLLKAAYPAAKAGDPAGKVLFGGLAGNDYRFLERALALVPDLGSYFDVMGVHPYTWYRPESLWRNAGGRIAEDLFVAYREVRASLLAHGIDKPIWFTEFGWATTSRKGGVSAREQADYLKRAFTYIEQDRYVQVACWYSFRNYTYYRDADRWEAQLGLMKSNFRRKPAFGAFRSYAIRQARLTR